MFWGRSILEVPSHRERLYEKAWAADCEGLMFDMEDCVPDGAEAKAAARALVRAQLGAHAAASDKRIAVRINHVTSEWFMGDVEALVGLPLDFVMLPMTMSADDVARTGAVLDAVFAPAKAPDMVVAIETPAALVGIREVIAAHPGVVAITSGGFDYTMATAPLQLIHRESDAHTPVPSHLDPFYFNQTVCVAVARASGLYVYDGLRVLDHKDAAAARTAAQLTRAVGFDGCIAYAPRLLPPINEAFGVSDAQRDWANEVIAVLEAAAKTGSTAAYTKYGTALNHHLKIARALVDGTAREPAARQNESERVTASSSPLA